MSAILSFEDISYYYQDGKSRVDILDDTSYSFEQGKTYAIVGASGTGKTTVVSLAAGLESPRSGKVLFRGDDLSAIGLNNYRRQDVSIVFQAYNLINYMNGVQNVVSAMDISHVKVPDKKQRALEILSSLGLSENEAKRDIRKLSGGQQQRIAIGRAMAKDVDLILCDEPTGNLDAHTSEDIVKTFISLAHKQNKCVIIVTHDQNIASSMDVQLTIEDGKIKNLKNS